MSDKPESLYDAAIELGTEAMRRALATIADLRARLAEAERRRVLADKTRDAMEVLAKSSERAALDRIKAAEREARVLRAKLAEAERERDALAARATLPLEVDGE